MNLFLWDLKILSNYYGKKNNICSIGGQVIQVSPLIVSISLSYLGSSHLLFHRLEMLLLLTGQASLSGLPCASPPQRTFLNTRSAALSSLPQLVGVSSHSPRGGGFDLSTWLNVPLPSPQNLPYHQGKRVYQFLLQNLLLLSRDRLIHAHSL